MEFKSLRSSAEHVADDFLGPSPSLSVYNQSPEDPFAKFQSPLNSWLARSNTHGTELGSELDQAEQGLTHLWEKIATYDKHVEHYESVSFQWQPNPDPILQELNDDFAMDSTASTVTQPTSADIVVVTSNDNNNSTAPTPVNEDSTLVQQVRAEPVVDPMVVEDADNCIDDATDVPPVAAGEGDLPPNNSFDAEELFEAYYEAAGIHPRRRTLSEAFKALFPVQTAANLIPVPKNKHQADTIATLAFGLQIKVSNAGRKGGAGATRRTFTKLHDALNKAHWKRLEDNQYYYYYRQL